MTPTGPATATARPKRLTAAIPVVAAVILMVVAVGLAGTAPGAGSPQPPPVGCATTSYAVEPSPVTVDQTPNDFGPNPVAVALADVDDDGRLDVATANSNDDTVSVFLNDGAGDFGEGTAYSVRMQAQGELEPQAVVAADFDGDGHTDLATANRSGSVLAVSGTVSVLSGEGDGTFGPAVEYPIREELGALSTLVDPHPVDVVADDFDGDDATDLATVNQDPDNQGSGDVSVLLNDGSGRFISPNVSSLGKEPKNKNVAVADFDGDDRPDLAVPSKNSDEVGVISGDGSSGFADTVWYETDDPGDVIATNFDGDEHPDVVTITNPRTTGDVSVLANDGEGGLTAPTQYDAGEAPAGLVAADITRNGYLDVATANNDSGEVAVLAGGADATLAPPTMCDTADRPNTVAAGDVDGDGTPDLITTSAFDDSMSVLRITGGIAGRVTADSGDPIGGTVLAVTDGDGDQAATATAGEDGRYTVGGLTAGDYTVSVAPADYQDASAETSVVGAMAATVDFTLTPSTGSLAGAVTDADSGDTVGGAGITVSDPDGATAATSETDGDGGYQIAGLEPATYTVSADHPDYRPASQDAGIGGGRTTTAHFALTPATGALAGTVTDADSGDPIGDADITVTDPDGDTAATDQTGGDGDYEIAALEAGDHTLTVDADGYQPRSRRTTVKAGVTTTEDAALDPEAGALAGQVTDADTGDPVDATDITVTDADGSEAGSATSGGDGDYEVVDLDPGDYTVSADHPDYQAESRDARVTGGETATVDFAVTPTSNDGGSEDDGGGDDNDGNGAAGSGGDDSSGNGDGNSDDGDPDNSDGSSDGDGGSTDGADGAPGDAGEEDEPVGPAAAVSRIAGGDRFATAAALSQRAYPDGAEVAYVATGFGFADALTGGVAAAADQGPLLLATRSAVPQATAGELDRLAPDRLVILGGHSVIDASVAQTLAGHAGRVDRLAGANRFATARAVAEATFPHAEAVDTVYLASGHTFADALAGGVAAAEAGAPLLLADRNGLPAPTRAALDRLAPQRVVLLGGPAALGEPVAETVAGFVDTVDRLAGPTRFATAAAIAADTFSDGPDQIMVTTGTAFPDALAGGAVAGARGVPVLLAAPSELTDPTRAAVGELNPASGWLLGGPGALSDQVETELNELLTDNAGH